MTNKTADIDVHQNKIARTTIYIVYFTLFSSIFPKLLPGWIAAFIGGWLGIFQPIHSAVNRGEIGAFALSVGIGYIQDAHSNVESERECLRAERDAFNEFIAEVSVMTVSVERTAATQTLGTKPRGNENQLQTIRDCYRETVMAVPHYEEDYGESLRENMTAEFNQDIATAIVDGQHFSPQLQQLLLQQAQSAIQRRENLIATIAQEQASLTNASRRLRETNSTLEETAEPALIQQSFSELVNHDEELRNDIDHCEQLLADRQQELHQKRRGVSYPNQTLSQYLYNSLAVSFPVLNATLDRIRKLQNRRRELIHALTLRN